MPGNISDNLKKHLDASVGVGNAYDTDANPFAGFLAKQKDAYAETKLAAWRAQNNNATSEQLSERAADLRNEFDEKKLPGLLDDLKKKTLARYNGKDDIKIENLVGGMTGGALTGNLMSMMTGGGIGGFFASFHHAIGGFILGLPVVGDFLGTSTTWIKSQFSGDKSLSWGEASQAYQSDKVKKHMTEGLSQYADMDKLNTLVDRAVAGETPPEVKKIATVTVPPEVKVSGITGGTEATHAPVPVVSTETVSPVVIAPPAQEHAP